MILEDLKHARINVNTSGDNEIIADPGDGKYIAIDFLTLNPDGGAQTLTFKSGSTTLFDMALDDNQPLTFENAMHHQKGVITIADSQAFNLNLGASTSVKGFCRYRIVNG